MQSQYAGVSVQTLEDKAMVFEIASNAIPPEPRYLVESQSGDTGVWEPMVTTDNVEYALGIVTVQYRRIVDRQAPGFGACASKAGEIEGTSHNFGYQFEVQSASPGPSFFV